MPIFDINNNLQLHTVQKTNFPLEKDLQTLIENNLITVFNCRFIASEFSTGAIHAGRIDTLALSEDNNPVIIEYKKVESSELITQSLFYLHWIQDHKGDFEIAAQKVLGNNIEIDWSDIRVICIAPNYKNTIYMQYKLWEQILNYGVINFFQTKVCILRKFFITQHQIRQ